MWTVLAGINPRAALHLYLHRGDSLKFACSKLLFVLAVAAFGPALSGLYSPAQAEDTTINDAEMPPGDGWATEVLTRPEQPVRRATASELSVGAAVNRALSQHPSLQAGLAEIDARHGEAAQAAVRPNPELGIDVENFAGNKSKSDATETTFALTQTLELGDKRFLRLRAAELDTSLAVWDYEVARMQVAIGTARAAIDVLTAQDRLQLLKDFVGIAEKTRTSVDARVKGGKASPIELDRTIVAAARAKALVKAEQARLDAAKRRLSIYWGAETVDFTRVTGRLGKGHRVPSMTALQASIENNPGLARWSDEIGRRVAQLNVEVSKSIPDVRVGAGVRHFNEDDSVAAVASLSVPLPLFDRNSGNIVAAESRIAKAERDRAAARNELLGALAEAVGALEIAAATISAFENNVLPPAQSAFERTKLGYDEGKFDILNVLDAQRAVFEARLDLMTARADYEKARVNVEAIVGRDLGGL